MYITKELDKYCSFFFLIEQVYHGRYGLGLKPPSYHEKVPLLKKKVENTNDRMKDHKESWRKHGCIIMSDGWRDRVNRDLLTFW